MKEKTLRRIFTPLILMMGLLTAPMLFAETLDSVAHYGNAQLATPANTNWAASVSAGGIPHGANFSGSASGNYTLTTGGADLWGGSDQGSFIYDNASGPRSGDFSAIVRMRVGEPGEVLAPSWGRSGIMARKSGTAANSTNVAHYRVFAGTGNSNTRMGSRDSDGAGTGDRGQHPNAGSVQPHDTTWVWLGLHRKNGLVATSWAPDASGSPGAWSPFITYGASIDLQGPLFVGLAHQNHNDSGEYAPEAPARQISTGVFEQFQVSDFNSSFGAAFLPPPGALPGPDGTCDHFGVYEVRGPGGNLAEAVTTLLTAPGALTAQLPKLDVTDPETNGTGGLVLTDPPIPYLTNTSGSDDDIKTVAKARLKVVESGYYTLNFHGDDGFAARIIGKEWIAWEGAGTVDQLADPATVFFANGTGDHNTRAVVWLDAGEFDFEYVNWEGAGGAYYEVTVASGYRLGVESQWRALGDPSVVPALPPAQLVSLNDRVDVYKMPWTQVASPNGDDFTAPSRFGDVGDGLIRDNILDNIGGAATTNKQVDTNISSAETPAGPIDNYNLGVFGSFCVDNGNGTPGESIELSFRVNGDDGTQLRIVGQSFTAFGGDAHTYLETISGDAAVTGDFFTGNSNAVGHITLVEGNYDFEAFLFEGGGGDKIEIGWQPGTIVDGTWIPMSLKSNTATVGIQLVDGTKSSVAVSFTSERDLAAILDPTDAAGIPTDSSTGSAFTNWNSTIGLPASADASGTTADIAAPLAGMLVADTGGIATPTAITVDWTSANTWNTNNGTGNSDNKLMNGYLDNNGANPEIPINLAGISSHFQDGYSVYVYIGSDGNGRTGTIENVGGATYSYSTNSQLAAAFPGAYNQTTDTAAGNPPANYAVFSGLSGDTQSFVFHRGSSNSGAHGIQIVGVPHPAAMLVYDGPADTDPAISNGQTEPVDYGVSPINTWVTRTIGLKNDGTRALVIPAGGVTVGPGFTVVNNTSEIVVQAGDTFGLLVRFDATGDYTSDVTINADCNCKIPFAFPVKGGVPPIIHCPENITVNAPSGGMSDPVDYLAWATDESGTATLVCDPMSGSQFPIGDNLVTCTATDEVGNETMASFWVIVLEIQAPEAMRVLDVVSLRGDAATGAGGAEGIPAGATIFSYNHAFISNDGTAIVEATLGDAGTGNVGLFEANSGGLVSALAAKGGPSAGGGPNYTAFDHLSIADDGTSSFSAFVTGGKGTYTDDGTTNAAATGSAAPGVAGGVFSILETPASSGVGNLFTPAHLSRSSGGVTVFNDTGIWNSTSGLVIREGDPAIAIPGATHGQFFSRVVANSSGEICFAGNVNGAGAANAAVWAGAPGSIAVVASRAASAPGTGGAVFSRFAGESISEAGNVAFHAFVTQAGVVTAADDEGIWTNRSGALELVARENDAAPCLAAPGPLFGRFTDMYVAEDGTVCFFAFLKGPGVTSANDGSFWRSSPDGTLHLVVREGDEANSTDGAALSRIVSVSCNNTSGVVYVGLLAAGLGDTVTNNNLGLWLDEGVELDAALVLRKSDTFDLGEDERTITSIGFDYTANSAGGTGGYGRIINDSGDVMLKLSLNGSLHGLFMLGTELASE
jgi:hypothetical protein